MLCRLLYLGPTCLEIKLHSILQSLVDCLQNPTVFISFQEHIADPPELCGEAEEPVR